MTQDLGETNPALVDWFRNAAPVGRLGTPQDLSPTVCHLLSDAGKNLLGIVLKRHLLIMSDNS
jgi:NAD(P)-dependent dehydrogenase (short-subunit alcohol dehydrogenase family)